MTIPYTFAGATTAIPLANLDANFASPITLGNVAMTLSNTYTSIGNLTLTNVTVSSGNVAVTNLSYTGTLTGGTGVVNLGSGQFYKDASGNVGIGTTTTGTTATGNITGTATVSDYGYTIFASENGFGAYMQGSTSGNTYAFIGNFKYNFTTPSSSYAPYSNAGYGINMGTNAIAFYSANAGGAGSFTPTERMRIDSSGNLNLGQTSGSNGASKLGIANDCGVQAMQIWTNTAGGSATQNIVLLYRGSTLVGSIQGSNTGTAYNTSSDYRLKENIAPMTGALNVVQKLNPVTYNWKVDGSSGQGFIAHELAEVVPDCVSGGKDAVDSEGKPVYQGIDTSFLVATLTAAIQELKAELDSVKAELQTLKGN